MSDIAGLPLPDTSGHDAPERDELHTVSLAELEVRVAAQGVLISRRQLMRHCDGGTFDAKKLPAVNNQEYWFIAPHSIDKGIADIKTLQEQRARRDVTGFVRTDLSKTDSLSHDGPQHAMSEREISRKGSETQPAAARLGATELDIFEHPYVKRLESQVEKWEDKYHEQVRRTEDIQLKSQQQIIELQRMTAIGQSETLADFMFKAKEWILGQGSEPEKRAADTPPTAT